MPDIALVWDPINQRADFAMAGPDLLTGQDLYTDADVILGTDAQAQPGDVIPDGSTNRRGWWADPTLGTRIWLLERAKKTPATLAAAQAYIAEGFKALTDAGAAAAVTVETWWQATSQGAVVLACSVIVTDLSGQQTAINYQWAWDQLG